MEHAWVRDRGGSWYKAQFHGADDQADIGILIISDDGNQESCIPDTNIRYEQLKFSQQVFCHGVAAQADDFMEVAGTVASPQQAFTKAFPEQRFRMVQLAIPTLPGMSGAPIFDEEGRLCAMMTKKYAECGLAVPATMLLKRVNNIISRIEESHIGIGLSLARHISARYIGSRVKTGLLIVSLSQNGIASAAGLQVGDVVISINGTPLLSPCDFVSMLETGCRLYILELIRGEEILKVNLSLK
jgi:serine protease Do